MISIIVSVYNQLGMNRLFVETLRKNTSLKYELIVIDNDSTDGSKEFFRENADVLIENDGNYSYPYCQNKGIDVAGYEYLAFLNNDILVTPGWDKRLIAIMESRGFDVISAATNDHMESPKVQKKRNNKWKRIKYPLKFLFGTGYRNLKLMAKLTYGNLDKFSEKRYGQFGDRTIEGFSGSVIVMNRRALEKVGKWDPRIQAADFDYFCMTKKRSLEKGDIKPINIALGVYVHHYQRLTLRGGYKPFADRDNMISVEEKWGAEGVRELMKDII